MFNKKSWLFGLNLSILLLIFLLGCGRQGGKINDDALLKNLPDALKTETNLTDLELQIKDKICPALEQKRLWLSTYTATKPNLLKSRYIQKACNGVITNDVVDINYVPELHYAINANSLSLNSDLSRVLTDKTYPILDKICAGTLMSNTYNGGSVKDQIEFIRYDDGASAVKINRYRLVNGNYEVYLSDAAIIYTADQHPAPDESIGFVQERGTLRPCDNGTSNTIFESIKFIELKH